MNDTSAQATHREKPVLKAEEPCYSDFCPDWHAASISWDLKTDLKFCYAVLLFWCICGTGTVSFLYPKVTLMFVTVHISSGKKRKTPSLQRIIQRFKRYGIEVKMELSPLLVTVHWRGDTALTLPLFWRWSTGSLGSFSGCKHGRAFTLSPSSSPVPIPNKQPHFCGHKATWSSPLPHPTPHVFSTHLLTLFINLTPHLTHTHKHL